MSDREASTNGAHHGASNGTAAEPADPYALLRVDRDATWEEIIAAYRRQVRWWHPDGLTEATDIERSACELRLRALNIAYHELRIRRGR
jgi:DnaJ like chaperone protein